MASKKLTIGGLCSGVGGIELGFRQAGFEIAWANDMDKNAMVTYESIIGDNHYIGRKAMRIEEIFENEEYKMELTNVDVVVAGFPCQAFSIAGYRKGFKDARGNVFFRIIDVLNHLKKTSALPRALLLENVKNFKTHDNHNTYQEVKNHLHNLGYSVYTKILNTKDYTDIPQNRERTFIVCYKGEKKWINYQFDELGSPIETQTKAALKDCPATMTFHNKFIQSFKKIKLKSIHDIINHNLLSEEFYYTKERFPKIYPLLEKSMDNEDTIYQYRRVYVRKNKNNLCPTLTANMGTGGHNVPLAVTYGGQTRNHNNRRFRKLTPEECFKFQGYTDVKLPKSMANCHLYKQAGNSVTVPLVKKLAHIIYRSILEIN